MPDDQAVRTVSAYEGAINQTPNIDRLADNAVAAENPFMLFVQFKAPHVPRMPEFRFLDKYTDSRDQRYAPAKRVERFCPLNPGTRLNRNGYIHSASGATSLL